jgi:hypothetical protein
MNDMTKLVIGVLINLICFSVFSQKYELNQQDIDTYTKVENGEFSIDFYLNAIIEKTISDSNVIELKKKLEDQGGIDEMLCIGLISLLLHEQHGSRHQQSHYFEKLLFRYFGDKLYFYQDVSLHDNKQLFIWGTYGQSGSGNMIHSAVGHNLNLTTYSPTFKTINNTDVIIFEAAGQVAIVPIVGDTAVTLKYDVSEFEKIGTYRQCVLSCDTCVKCKSLRHKGKSDQVEVQQRIFTTELMIEDIDDDGSIDLYWFAVSNGELVKYEAYNFGDGELIPLTKDIEELIIGTTRFDEMKRISILEQIPNL